MTSIIIIHIKSLREYHNLFFQKYFTGKIFNNLILQCDMLVFLFVIRYSVIINLTSILNKLNETS